MRMHLNIKYSKYVIAGITTTALAVLCYHLFPYDNFHEVVPGRVYRSKQLSAQRLQHYINRKNIRSIINLRDEQKDKRWYEDESDIAIKSNLNLYNIGISAYRLPAFERINLITDVLQTAERPVLIHCNGGAHRTGFVSALALALETDAPLSSLEEQFSWRYGVLPVRNHVGELFFSQYENWLQQNNRRHNRSNLLFWIRNEYVDDYANLRFNIDSVNDKPFEQIASGTELRASLSQDSETIAIKGWALSARSKAPVEKLFVVIGGQQAGQVDYRYIRPDVAKYFNLDEKYYKSIKLGWLAKFDAGALASGCHELSLRVVQDDSSPIDVDTDWQICLQ